MREMSADEYFSVPALNSSTLKAFAKVPALAHVAREETAAMVLGSLVHCAILEPESLAVRYQPTDLDRRGTKAWADTESKSCGRELVKRADWDTAIAMRDAVWSNPVAAELLSGAQTEQSVFWDDALTGYPCKARADAVNNRLNVLIDVKTTVDASPREFARQFTKMGYGLQDAHYRAGFSASDMVFIAVEKNPPYLVAMYELSAEQLAVYTDRRAELVASYAECVKSGLWPGYDANIQILELPWI